MATEVKMSKLPISEEGQIRHTRMVNMGQIPLADLELAFLLIRPLKTFKDGWSLSSNNDCFP